MKTLEQWLKTVSAMPASRFTQTLPNLWWIVLDNERGIVAAFPIEARAQAYRLDYINRKLNLTP
jgi:hypothetical protein